MKIPSQCFTRLTYFVMRWSRVLYSSFTYPTTNWESLCMMIFSEDTKIVRSIQDRIALYSASLLDAGKSNLIAYSIFSPGGALSCKLTLTPVCREASSTLRTHQSVLPGFASCWGIFAKKSANICSFIAKRALYWIPNSLSSIAQQAILPYKSGLCMVLHKGRLVNTMIECAWK